MGAFRYDLDADGVVTVTMDMSGPVNAINAEYDAAMGAAVERLEAETDLSGVILASAKREFFAGGDLNALLAVKSGEEARFFADAERIKGQLRRLEKLPVPVVAAINGSALGGGFEICLACNHRIAYDDRSVQIGFPEVTLGLLPGGGGVVRMVNLVGLEAALPYLLEGKRVTPEQAREAGLIHETVAELDDLLPRAKAWIAEHRNDESAAVQPWDRKGFKIPGGGADSPRVAQVIMMAPPMLLQKTRGLLPAPEAILDCAVAAVRLDLDTALRVESRAITRLVTTPECKNMITAFFFQLNQVNGGASRPEGIAPRRCKRLGILGAGMMGQGIAYVAARAGIDVVLKDLSREVAEKGKAYSEKLLSRRVAKGRMSEADKAAALDRIRPTGEDTDLTGCDLIVEAVFENLDLKNEVTAATERFLAEDGIWGSNTSTLPITRLAEASSRPDKFIGLHFFSPVDRMPLLEIICGEKTSEDTLAGAFDFARQIRKTPIVVNDSLGFFTSRTFGTYLDEGIRLLREGVHPVRVDNLGKAVGMPVGPLAVHDEVSLSLSQKLTETWDMMGVGDRWGERELLRETVATMTGEYGRGGRHHGGGFYEYGADGGKEIWPELLKLYYKPELAISDEDVKDRLLLRQVIESLKCLESGVLRSVADGNIGSIMGIGAPAWTGGFIQFVNTYGLERFARRCSELADRYGERFIAPVIVAEKIKAGEQFV